jgi:hypothetical protein
MVAAVRQCDGVVTFWLQSADGETVWWLWVVGVLAAWTGIALIVAVIVGRGIRLADLRSSGAGADSVLTTEHVQAGAAARRPSAARVRRRAIPLPPVGIGLVVLAVALETAGYIARLNGSTGSTARLLSMDAPLSLPRMFVAALFAAAAFAAFAGAGTLPGRRAWWTAVGVVSAGIAAVKAGGSVHVWALHALSAVFGTTVAVVVSAVLAAVVVGGLWFLSRNEQRDRRRVLSVLTLYAGAAVGLSEISALAANAFGGASHWAAATTFIEESGEALAGVAFLVAVLVGVAPRLVLPASWALRRQADAHTLDLADPVAGRTARGGAAHR